MTRQFETYTQYDSGQGESYDSDQPFFPLRLLHDVRYRLAALRRVNM